MTGENAKGFWELCHSHIPRILANLCCAGHTLGPSLSEGLAAVFFGGKAGSPFLARRKNKTSETQGISTRAWVKIGIETAHRNSVSVSLTKVISDYYYYYYYTTLHFSPRCILAAIYACATRENAICYLRSSTTQIMAAMETTSASPKMLLNTSLATVYVRDNG